MATNRVKYLAKKLGVIGCPGFFLKNISGKPIRPAGIAEAVEAVGKTPSTEPATPFVPVEKSKSAVGPQSPTGIAKAKVQPKVAAKKPQEKISAKPVVKPVVPSVGKASSAPQSKAQMMQDIAQLRALEKRESSPDSSASVASTAVGSPRSSTPNLSSTGTPSKSQSKKRAVGSPKARTLKLSRDKPKLKLSGVRTAASA